MPYTTSSWTPGHIITKGALEKIETQVQINTNELENNTIKANETQQFTESQQATARNNIGAIGNSELTENVDELNNRINILSQIYEYDVKNETLKIFSFQSKHTISFYNNDTLLYSIHGVPHGSEINVEIDEPEHEDDMKFKGWYTDNGIQFVKNMKVTEDLIFSAQWL